MPDFIADHAAHFIVGHLAHEPGIDPHRAIAHGKGVYRIGEVGLDIEPEPVMGGQASGQLGEANGIGFLAGEIVFWRSSSSDICKKYETISAFVTVAAATSLADPIIPPMPCKWAGQSLSPRPSPQRPVLAQNRPKNLGFCLLSFS